MIYDDDDDDDDNDDDDDLDPGRAQQALLWSWGNDAASALVPGNQLLVQSKKVAVPEYEMVT